MHFQVGVYHENIQIDQIQNGGPAANFDFNMHNNWKTVPDSQTITIEQNVRFQVGIYRGNFNFIKFKIADLQPLLLSIYVVTGKPCQIPGPLLLNKMCGFREGYVLTKLNSIKLQMADMWQLSTSKCVIIIWKTVPCS